MGVKWGNAWAYNQGRSSSTTNNTGSSTDTPVWDSTGLGVISKLTNYTPTDVNEATQQAIAAQNAKTQAELGGLQAAARSSGYGRAANWGQGNVASATAQALASRDAQNALLQSQAAQQNEQNRQSVNQGLTSLLSLLRGSQNNYTNSSKTTGKTTQFNNSGYADAQWGL